MQNMLEQGPGVGLIQLISYIPLCSPNTCKFVFNPNVTKFQSKCAEGLHFSAFIIHVFVFFHNFVLCNEPSWRDD